MKQFITATHSTWGGEFTGESLKDIVDQIGCEEKDLVVLKTMSETEYILKDVPEEFKGALSYMAYEHGHSAGEDEVNMILEGIISDLMPSIKKFEESIRASMK